MKYMEEPCHLSARETLKKIRLQELRAEDCVFSIFNRVEEVEEQIHAYVTLTKELALQQAREIDRKVKQGDPLGRLAGICIALKDNLCTEGIITSCSSRMLDGFRPPFNATVVDRLLKEDAIIIGKTNMDEFAMGSSTETSYFGATRNPWDSSRVPGGSSGGSAAAVAGHEAILALGSDTGGSVRCPASFCSIVGLKPTYGLVSRYGLIAYANSLDQIGPISRDVYDCALLLNIIAGYDPKDNTSIRVPKQDYTQFLENDVSNLKVGIPKEFFGEGIDERVSKGTWKSIDTLENLGATCEELSLPTLRYTLATYYLIAMSEASSNLARYDGIRYGYSIDDFSKDWSNVYSKNRKVGFGSEVKRRIILGTYALSTGYYDEYYLKALKVRTLIREDFNKAFKKFDVLVGPTMPIPPFKIGEKITDPLSLYLTDLLTVPVNLIGSPAISVPCGFVNDLPIGMQIIAPALREDLLLKAAYTYEQNTPFQGYTPPL
jgi:aspartyl-tRNA(Asn)/glutamyl-tRNA(Gln) amidotransferase subunit A